MFFLEAPENGVVDTDDWTESPISLYLDVKTFLSQLSEAEKLTKLIASGTSPSKKTNMERSQFWLLSAKARSAEKTFPFVSV